MSDVLSFYSMEDGMDDRASSKVSFGGLASPQSFRSQSPSSGAYATAAEDGGGGGGGGAASSGGRSASSPVSFSSRYMSAASSLHPASMSSVSRYESATSGLSLSSPTSQQYETASQGSSSSHGGGGGGGNRTYSSMSFDSHTLQPDR